MSLSPAFLDDLRARVPLSRLIGKRVTWDLRRSNQAKGDWWAPCPFHHEKTASFHVDDAKGFYYCFGCHAKGDALTFLRETDGMSFMEAAAALAAEAGVSLPQRDRTPEARAAADRRTQLFEVMEQAVRWFRLQLQTGAAAGARDYLDRRGLDVDRLNEFGIGYAPDSRSALTEALRQKGVAEALIIEAGLAARPEGGGSIFDRFRGRIIFPIRDPQGRAIALGGRSLDPQARAKYLNSPETPLFDKGRTLYNLGPARTAVGRGQPLIVAEGYMDVIALSRAGFAGAVAPLGTAITEDQLRTLWRVSPEPVIALDGDSAGLRAAMRVVDLALPLASPLQALRFAILPAGQDPDDLIRAGGPGAMQSVLDAAAPLVELLWQRETEGRSFDSPERRAALEHALKVAAARIGDPSTRTHTEAELRSRWQALFAPPRGQGRADRGRGRKGVPLPPEGPRASTRTSLLVTADEGDALLEATVLALVARHPGLVAAVEARLERLEPADPARASLLHDLLAGEESRAGRAALDAILNEPHVRSAPWLARHTDTTLLAMILGNALDRLEARRAGRNEGRRAEVEIAADTADEGLTWRVAQIGRSLDAAARPELPDGIETSEEAAAMSAALQARLDADLTRKR